MANPQAIENRKFKFLLNGTEDLQQQLQDFKKACDAHEKHRRKRHKRRYYQMGLVAKLVRETTFEELKRLLKNGVRTFMLDAVTTYPDYLEDLSDLSDKAIREYELEEGLIQPVVSIALEVQGDTLRLGRMHNNCSVLLEADDIITLTTDESYQNTGFKEIVYVSKLKYYHKNLKLGDEINVGKEVSSTVIKKLKNSVAVAVKGVGLLNSYDYVDLPKRCYLLKDRSSPDIIEEDLCLVDKFNAKYIVMTKIRCKDYLKRLRSYLSGSESLKNLKVIGAIDYNFISSQMLDLMGIIRLLDYLWIPDLYTSRDMLKYIYEEVIPISKGLKKPIIGSVPLERCSEFRRFENHDFLWQIDAMFIQKSSWCNKYPLIVKKLLPIRDFRLGAVQNCATLKNIVTSYQSIVNFIIRTISSVECQAIILHSECDTAAIALSRVEIYCPVLVMLPIGAAGDDDVDNCKMNLARDLNLRRNVQCIVYTPEINELQLKPLEFGICYGRRSGLLDTGDLVITLEVCKEDPENVQYGQENDVVILRAYYLPALKYCERMRYE